MGLFDYTSSEYDFLRKSYTEANWLLGTECIYYASDSVVKDTSNDPDITLKEGVTVNVIFDSNPKATMKSLHWYVPGSEELPFVVFISSQLRDGTPIEVTQYSTLEVPYQLEQNGERLFRVDKVQGDTVRPLMYTCKLVPIYGKVDMVPETPEVDETINPNGEVSNSGFNYIKAEDLL